MNRKVRLIFFDMEGTIFESAVHLTKTKVPRSAWYVIAESLGSRALAEETKTQDKWNSQQYLKSGEKIRGHNTNYLKKESIL